MTAATLTAADAVRMLSRASGDDYTLIGPLAGGETGATAISGPHGRRFVLKWSAEPTDQALRRKGVQLADRLRTGAGWPVPAQQVVDHDGWLFVVQDFLTGDPVSGLSHAFVDDVLELHGRRLGLQRPDDADDWAEDLIETLVVGGAGYCLHEPLRGHDHRTRRVVERIEEIGRSLRPDDLRGDDIVHADLHAGNMLQTGGRLVAVVDLDYARVGDAAFDLTTLAMTSLEMATEPGVRHRLFEVGVDSLTEPRRSAYLAHLLLRVLDWPIRKARPAEIEFWLRHADDLLPE